MEINKFGLVESPRKDKDGIVYFGNTDVSPHEGINDFSIPEEESKLSSKHFKIFYKNEDNHFYIQTIDEPTGTFMQIEKKIVNILIIK